MNTPSAAFVRGHVISLARLAACSGSLALAAALPALPGCAAVGGAVAAYQETEEVTIPAEYTGLAGRKVAILVDAPLEIQYEHPEVVAMITDVVGLNVRAYCPQALVLDTRQTLAYQYNNVYWSTMDYAQLCRDLEADRVILVDLNNYRLIEPGNPYLWDGRAGADVNVIEAESPDPTVFAFRKSIAVRFPGMDGVTREDATEQQVAQGLQIALCQAISRLFHDHVRTRGDIKDQTRRDTGKRI